MRSLSTLLTLAVIVSLGACGPKKPDLSAAEKKIADAEQLLQEARKQTGAAQRVAELEKQLEEAKKELAAVQKASEAAPAPAAAKPEPPPPPPKTYTLPAGATIAVRTTTALSTKSVQTGDPISASLTAPLIVDGEELAPAGAEVAGVVALSDSGGRVKGRASLSITLKSIAGKHGPIPVTTGNYQKVAASTVKKDVVRGSIMSGAGAAIGAIAGGGKGAAIGAGIGGAAGVGTAMATKGAAAVIPAESAIAFTLKHPVTVTVEP
jgi:predicted small lipoprotein YifL